MWVIVVMPTQAQVTRLTGLKRVGHCGHPLARDHFDPQRGFGQLWVIVGKMVMPTQVAADRGIAPHSGHSLCGCQLFPYKLRNPRIRY